MDVVDDEGLAIVVILVLKQRPCHLGWGEEVEEEGIVVVD